MCQPKDPEQAGCGTEPGLSTGQLPGPHCPSIASVNGMPSRCALVPGTGEGGFGPSKLNNKCSFLTSAGLYRSPAPSWREEPQVCQTEKQSYPIQPPCGALGQGNLARSLRDSRRSRKPETRAAEGRRWAGGAEYRREGNGENRTLRAFLAIPDLPKWREKPFIENDSLWESWGCD